MKKKSLLRISVAFYWGPFELLFGELVRLFLFRWGPDGGGPDIRVPDQQLLTMLTLKSASGNDSKVTCFGKTMIEISCGTNYSNLTNYTSLPFIKITNANMLYFVIIY